MPSSKNRHLCFDPFSYSVFCSHEDKFESLYPWLHVTKQTAEGSSFVKDIEKWFHVNWLVCAGEHCFHIIFLKWFSCFPAWIIKFIQQKFKQKLDW
jgi:hypothetical protein